MRPIRAITALLIGCGLAAQAPGAGSLRQLSLQDALRTALQNNLQVQIAQEARTATSAAVDIARGTFDWNLLGGFNYGRQDSATTRSLYPLGPLATTDTRAWNRSLVLGVQKPFEWGGNLQANYSPVYSSSKGDYQDPNTGAVLGRFSSKYPYSASLAGTYTQSLLRGFGRQVNEVNLIVAKKGSQVADYQFSLALINLMAATESQYWDLVYAARNLENVESALALAQEQLDDSNTKVREGVLAGIEVTGVEAAVAQRKQALILAKSQLRNAHDTLQRTLFPHADRQDRLEPSDLPELASHWTDETVAEKMALECRVELKVGRLTRESLGAQRLVAENRLLPQLNAFASYNAGSDNRTALGPANADLASATYPGYAVGFSFALPLGNHAAKGGLAQARANERGSELSLRDLELAVRLQVRLAFENVESARESITAASETRRFREEDLRAEQKKFDLGMSTTFLVLAKQNDLDTSKSAELQARISFAKSLTALEQATGNLLAARGFALPE
jgi:outer membrane protein TolC